MLRVRHTIKTAPTGEIRLEYTPIGLETSRDRLPRYLTETPKYKRHHCKTFRCACRSGFGALPRPTDFVRRGKRQVRERASAIELLYGKQNCLFATATLPGSTDISLEYIARYSGWITQQLNQWLRDTFVGGFDFVYVWERQKRGALHVHYLVGLWSELEQKLFAERWRAAWRRILITLSARTGVDMFERRGGGSHMQTPDVLQCDVQRVTKSVTAYLAKYLSKQQPESITDGALYPSRWWGSSAGAKEKQRQLSEVATCVSPGRSVAAEVHNRALGRLSDAAGVVFQFTDMWRNGRVVAIAFVSPLAVQELGRQLADTLGAALPRSNPKPVRFSGRASPSEVARMFSGQLVS